MGNLCNGGSLFFVRYSSNKSESYRFSPVIGYCGGPDVKIVANGDTVTLSVPDHAPNRGKGTVKGWSKSYNLKTGVLK